MQAVTIKETNAASFAFLSKSPPAKHPAASKQKIENAVRHKIYFFMLVRPVLIEIIFVIK